MRMFVRRSVCEWPLIARAIHTKLRGFINKVTAPNLFRLTLQKYCLFLGLVRKLVLILS